MISKNKIPLFLLRISLGWLYFWAGFTKIINPSWSAAGYLEGAKLFPEFYAWLASPSILPITNFLNEWGLFLLGISLLLGLGVRFSTLFGVLLMVLYYIPLGVPYPNPHSLIVDEHIVYAAALLVLYASYAGRFWGLGSWATSHPSLKGWFD